jgi:transmembrane sensor
MTDLERETAVDPRLGRVQPRWSGARTERNLAATFDRITRARRARRVGAGALALAASGAVAAFAIVSQHRGPETVAAVAPLAAPVVSRPGAVAEAPPAREARPVEGAPVAPGPARAAAAVKVSRVDVKIAGERLRFRQQVAQRQYAAAYRSLVAAPGMADHSAEDLMLAADAARLSGHPAEAVPYLQKLLREHARDARAPLAAFTMGRILLAQLARPAEAADAFALTRRLAPEGALAADALAREVEAAAGAGDAGRARARAQEYVSKYPSGRRAEAVRRAGGLE